METFILLKCTSLAIGMFFDFSFRFTDYYWYLCHSSSSDFTFNLWNVSVLELLFVDSILLDFCYVALCFKIPSDDNSLFTQHSTSI